jgi:hypothetical protein
MLSSLIGACPPIPILGQLVKQPHYIPTPSQTRIYYLVQIDSHVDDIVGFISLGNPWQPNHIKVNICWYEEVSLAREWNSFHLCGKKLDYLHLKDFLKHECELYLKQPLTPPQPKIIVAYLASNHTLAIEIGWWTLSSISRDTRLCHACSYNAIVNEAHFVLESPLHNRTRDRFPSLFENVGPRSLESSFN